MKDLIIQFVVLSIVGVLIVSSGKAKAERDDQLTKLMQQLDYEAEITIVPIEDNVESELIYEDPDIEEYNQGKVIIKHNESN